MNCIHTDVREEWHYYYERRFMSFCSISYNSMDEQSFRIDI
jgi:hypothetical protein